MKGKETFHGYEFEVEKAYDMYLAHCIKLRFSVCSDTWEEMRMVIDDIVKDLKSEFGSLEEYEKIISNCVFSDDV